MSLISPLSLGAGGAVFDKEHIANEIKEEMKR